MSFKVISVDFILDDARNWAFLPVATEKSCEDCPVWATHDIWRGR